MKKKIWKNPNNLNELEVDENCLIISFGCKFICKILSLSIVFTTLLFINLRMNISELVDVRSI